MNLPDAQTFLNRQRFPRFITRRADRCRDVREFFKSTAHPSTTQ